LNEQRQITNVFAGDLLKAHPDGTEFVRQSAMQKVDAPFDVVVTTNSGYPLDFESLSRRQRHECAAGAFSGRRAR